MPPTATNGTSCGERRVPTLGGRGKCSEGPSPLQTSAIPAALMEWGRANFQDFPWRAPIPPWQALVVEIMLARTRAAQVVPVFENFRTAFATTASLASVTTEQIEELTAPLGLRWRGALIHLLLTEIARRDGHLPETEEELLELPGVGPYVAAASLSLHRNIRAVIVDSNVVRVICRLLRVPFDGETRRKTWLREIADSLTPDSDSRTYGYAMLDLAMQVCTPVRPRCEVCPLTSLCASAPTHAESPEHI